MLFVLYLVCILLICVNAEHTVRCNNETNPSINSVTLVPSPDHVGGRYVMEWCTAAGANITAWEFYINYNISMNPNQCKHYNFIHDSKFAYHSHLEENTNINLNCSHVCFSTSIDLIFKACYHIKNQVIKGRVKMQSYDQLIYITNNFTNSTVLKNSAPAATSYNSDEYVSVQWFTGSVPAAKFTMNLNSVTESGADVTQNCTSAVYTVTCLLRVPPGSYSLMFTHEEPWTYGRIAVDKISKDFNRTAAEAEVEVGVGAGVWGVWGAWGTWVACGALALCVPAALLLHRACARSPPHTKRDEAEAGAALGALLQEVAGEGGVYDVYAAEVSAQAARAPAEWLRAVLCREEVRVVVLQTPAAACLYAAQLRQRGYTLAREYAL
ncbi:uncharacterized protein LOC123720927 [Papilio machaon]|uniref:uncharacterized protein LOC123720927 n=1 Tax=Papilio machaon TaxID=76193 RepID=UPI001E665318|nr:uncharacterized protein LOC123720927 [Papilio machaon]